MRVQRSTDGQIFDWYVNLPANATSFTDTGLTDGTRYFYRVRAFGNGQDTAYSPKEFAVTALPPVDSLTLRVLPGGRAEVGWFDQSTAAQRFSIEWSIDSETWNEAVTVTAEKSSANQIELPLAQVYVRVRAINDFLGALPTLWDNFEPIDVTTAVDAPQNFAATVGADLELSDEETLMTDEDPDFGGEVNLTWTNNPTTLPDGIEVEMAKESGPFELYDELAAIQIIKIAGLDHGTDYSFRLRSYRGPIYSAYTPILHATPSLPRPTGFHADAASDTEVNLRWKDNARNETAYRVQYMSSGGTWTNVSLASNATGFTVTGLTANTKYQFRVAAVKGSGLSAWAFDETGTRRHPDGVQTYYFHETGYQKGSTVYTHGGGITFTPSKYSWRPGEPLPTVSFAGTVTVYRNDANPGPTTYTCPGTAFLMPPASAWQSGTVSLEDQTDCAVNDADYDDANWGWVFTQEVDSDYHARATIAVQTLDGAASEAGSDPATFRLSRTPSIDQPLSEPLIVQFHNFAGSASRTTDYRLDIVGGSQVISNTVIMPANQAAITLTLTPFDDTEVEADETVALYPKATADYLMTTANIGASSTIANAVSYAVKVKWIGQNTAASKTNLDNNPNVKGGKRIYPDKDSPGDTVSHDLIDVEATVTPTPPAGTTVHFEAFDVDDPNADPSFVLDSNDAIAGGGGLARGMDNRGTSPGIRGSLGAGVSYAASGVANRAGKVRLPFRVTMQPGDNFRVAASLDPARLVKLTTFGQAQPDAGSRYVPAGDQQIGGGVALTQMLTTWRRLWVERDSMTGVTANPVAVSVTAVTPLVPQAGTGGTNDVATLNITLPDSEDAFEGGKLSIFGRTIPIYRNSDNLIFSDTVNLPGGAFTAVELAAIAAAPVAGTIIDDDAIPVGGTMHLPDGGSLITSAFGEAYITPKYVDPGPGSANVRGTIQFVRHFNDNLNAGNASNDLAVFASPAFWTTLVVGAFERRPSTDADADGLAPPGLGIPNPSTDSAFDYGVSPETGDTRNVSILYLETIGDFVRQGNFFTDEAHAVTHEIAHTAGGGLDHAPTGILRAKAPKSETDFDVANLAAFRGLVSW